MGDLVEFAGVMGILVGMPLTIMLLFPIAKAVARRLEGRVTPADEELEALRAELADLRAVAERVPELEERLDFAERLLGRQADAARLSAGGD